MTEQERFKEISKTTGAICNQMLDLMKKTDDAAIRLIATEVIYAGGYIQGLCNQPFDTEME